MGEPLTPQEVDGLDQRPVKPRSFRKRSEDDGFDALQRFCDAAWFRARKHALATFTIPVNEDRDADCILADLIAEAIESRATIADRDAEIARLRSLGDRARGLCNEVWGLLADLNSELAQGVRSE